MGEAVAADSPEKMRRDVALFNRKLERGGIYCGVPLIAPGDEFILAKHDSPSMRPMRMYVDEMQKANDESTAAKVSAPVTETAQEPKPVVRNSWRFTRGQGENTKQFHVSIVEVNPDAPPEKRHVRLEKIEIITPSAERFEFAAKTIMKGAQVLAAAERKALTKLRELVEPEQYKNYLLTGAIVEDGKSGVFYVIRKYRPTVAVRPRSDEFGGKVLCALCLHPVGYFSGTWAGALPPTDEVVAHLLLIRNSEHAFWKEANQIPLHEANSGV